MIRMKNVYLTSKELLDIAQFDSTFGSRVFKELRRTRRTSHLKKLLYSFPP